MKLMIRNILLMASSAGAVMSATAATAADPVIKPYYGDRNYKGATIRPATDLSLDMNGSSAPVFTPSSGFLVGFEGVSQYDGASFGRNFVPPDTMGAVGRTQYMETLNGVYAVFDKYTGARLSTMSDVSFWNAAGQTGTNGDSRIMYNAAAKRWVAIAFGSSVSNINIAVSDTDNALGTWKSTSFTGFAGGTADYPTLALDKNAVYIGTNNFNAAGNFRGTTLNVIPLNSLFNAVTPTTTGIQQFVTAYPGGFEDRGFAIQGVNSTSSGSTGKVVANSLFYNDNLTYTVNGLSPSSAAGATRGAVEYIGGMSFTDAGKARQPNAVVDTDINLADTITSNNRVVDALDQRISSSVYEVNGRIYMVQTVARAGEDYARVRVMVIDSATNGILYEKDIGTGTNYDYFQGSIAVNALGQVVIGYNRSGSDVADGKIRIYAAMFNTNADGTLQQVGKELFIKESLIDDYHNGSVAGQVANGRQRWGDYSQVSVDPTNPHGFYMIGQFAREYNNAAGGHPGGTGGSRWSTYIAALNVAGVPEPASWAMMLVGFGALGGAIRRRRYSMQVRYG